MQWILIIVLLTDHGLEVVATEEGFPNQYSCVQAAAVVFHGLAAFERLGLRAACVSQHLKINEV